MILRAPLVEIRPLEAPLELGDLQQLHLLAGRLRLQRARHRLPTERPAPTRANLLSVAQHAQSKARNRTPLLILRGAGLGRLEARSAAAGPWSGRSLARPGA